MGILARLVFLMLISNLLFGSQISEYGIGRSEDCTGILSALGISSDRSWQAECSGNLIWWLDTPEPDITIGGMVIVSGWILSHVGISRIDCFVDDEYIGEVNLDVPRDDVIDHYPEYAYSPCSMPGITIGFNSEDYLDGEHSLHLVVTDGNDSQTIIGRRNIVFDSSLNPGPVGYLEKPQASEIISGAYPVQGWAYDDDLIDRVDVYLDGAVVSGARIGERRPDIFHVFPSIPETIYSGFIFYMDTTNYSNGFHTLDVQAVDKLGARRLLGSRTVQFDNEEENLEPFGILEWPIKDATLWGCCEPDGICQYPGSQPIQPLNWVKGWALDVDLQDEASCIAYTEVMVDGSIISNSTLDCYYDAVLDTYVNCCRIPRPDVEYYFFHYEEALLAGFQFLINVGDLIANYGYVEGMHHITIKVADHVGTIGIIADTPVVFRCLDRVPTAPGFGFIDHPTPYEMVYGTIHLIGWAIDYDQIEEVRIYVMGDDNPYDSYIVANYGWERQDVFLGFEMSPLGLYSGWDAYLDTTLLSDGENEITVEIIDIRGVSTLIGTRRFIVDN